MPDELEDEPLEADVPLEVEVPLGVDEPGEDGGVDAEGLDDPDVDPDELGVLLEDGWVEEEPEFAPPLELVGGATIGRTRDPMGEIDITLVPPPNNR